MTDKEVSRYLELMVRRVFILTHSGISWKPEYGSELAAIDRELSEFKGLDKRKHKKRGRAA